MWSNENYLPGIDVSAHKGIIDWAKVSQSVVAFSFIKASEGLDYKDPNFDRNWVGTRRNGIIRGAYHFFIANQDPAKQAQNYLEQVGDILHSSDLPPVIDVESSPRYVYEAMTSISLEERLANLNAWLEIVAQATHRKPIIYTNYYTWKIYMGDTQQFLDHKLWVANFDVEIPSVPAKIWGGKGWSFWQFSYKGVVPCIYNEMPLVYQNIYRGKLEDMKAWLNINATRPLAPELENHQMLEAIKQSAASRGDSLDDWLLRTNLSYLALARNAQRPYDGPAVSELALNEDEQTLLKSKIRAFSSHFEPNAYTQLSNQEMINACYVAARQVGISGWAFLVKADGVALVNNREGLYTGPKIEEMANLNTAEKQALADALGIDPLSEEYFSEESTQQVNPEESEAPVEASPETPAQEEPQASQEEDPSQAQADLPQTDSPDTSNEVEPDQEENQAQPIVMPDQIFGFPPETSNQDMINAIYQVAAMFGLGGWALLDIAGLTHLIDHRNALYDGQTIDEMGNLSTEQKKALAEILGVVLIDSEQASGSQPDLLGNDTENNVNEGVISQAETLIKETYPGLVNQDIINLMYQGAAQFGDNGWAWLSEAGLTYIASSREMRYKAYRGPKLEDLQGLADLKVDTLMGLLKSTL